MKSRDEIKSNLIMKKYDIIIIGGGATGSGIALDAASRGLKVALVEKNDFSSGTSSRSTKLVHGGVRYLEQAVFNFDKVQFNLVKDALQERYLILNKADYLSNKLTLVTPLYKTHEVPYVYAGLLLYDLLSGRKSLGRSKILSKGKVENLCKVVKKENLKGGVMYYDGQFNDTRFNIALLKTAVRYGADICNYLKVCKLLKNNSKIIGIEVEDVITKECFEIYGRAIVNATGPFIDTIRRLDNEKIDDMITVSSGVHIVIDGKYTSNNCGLMIPKTEDGRVLFILPWNGYTLVGTTDEEATVEDNPIVQKKDIDYLLRHINKYFQIEINEDHIKSKWSGLRPLVKDPNKSDTAKLARDHVIEILPSNLFSIAGGKWTTYRKMAKDLVDKVVQYFNLATNSNCITNNILIDGMPDKVHLSKISYNKINIDKSIINRLHNRYGSNMKDIFNISNNVNLLYDNYPIIEEEIRYNIREEFAVKPADILIRRTMLALVDLKGAKEISNKVVEIMSKELLWNDKRRSTEEKELADRLYTSI